MSQVKVVNFEWFDTGNTKSYNEVRKVFNNEVVANKSDEALFIDNNKVVKYFSDKNGLFVGCGLDRTNANGGGNNEMDDDMDDGDEDEEEEESENNSVAI